MSDLFSGLSNLFTALGMVLAAALSIYNTIKGMKHQTILDQLMQVSNGNTQNPPVSGS